MKPYELSFTISGLNGRHTVRADIYGKPSDTGTIIINKPGVYKFQKKLNKKDLKGEPYKLYFDFIESFTDTQSPAKS